MKNDKHAFITAPPPPRSTPFASQRLVMMVCLGRLRLECHSGEDAKLRIMCVLPCAFDSDALSLLFISVLLLLLFILFLQSLLSLLLFLFAQGFRSDQHYRPNYNNAKGGNEETYQSPTFDLGLSC